MVDLPHTFPGYIQQEETKFKAAISEYTASRMGQAMNALRDSLNPNIAEFTTPGTFPLVIPAGVTSGFVAGAGGGGSGASGRNNPGSSWTAGGSGGNGSDLNIRYVFGLTPGATINVVVGAGGATQSTHASAGNSGGDTTFDGQIISKGASGGTVGLATSANPTARLGHTTGGSGGPGDGIDGFVGSAGQASSLFDGGAAGAFPATNGGGGGGGGAGAFGAGGVGEASPSAGSYGAGGGGGRGGTGWTAGAAGLGGYLAFYYWST